MKHEVLFISAMPFKDFLLAVLVFMPSIALANNSLPLNPPTTSIEQLRSALSSGQSGVNLHQLLFESYGILRISLGGDNESGHDDFSALRQRALSHLCDCPTFRSSMPFPSSSGGEGARKNGVLTFEEALESHPKDVQQISLPDGSVRRTLASATVGFDTHGHHNYNEGGSNLHHHGSALELPSWVQDTCGKEAYESFEELRDVVAETVDSFVERLDQENKSSNSHQSYRQILSNANHLEHFHVYTKTSTPSAKVDNDDGGLRKLKVARVVTDDKSDHQMSAEAEAPTLDYHTDAGFFLAFVPAMSCHSYETDNSSFFLKGQKEPITFGDDEIVIMLGAGAQYWLPSTQDQYPLLAASHALRLLPDTQRAWYGKMHLLPSSFTAMSANLEQLPSSIFGEVLPSFQLKDYNAHVPSSPVDGCGTTALNDDSSTAISLDTRLTKQSHRRRLKHVNSPADCNNQTDFFCWHQCLNIPESEKAEEYVQNGYSLYCLDPAKLSSLDDSIFNATDPCQGGFAHNGKCTGSWHETDEDIPGYKLPYEVKEKEMASMDEKEMASMHHSTYTEGGYCSGGTSMYMDGFNWQGTTCVIYLFNTLVLSTPGKFAAAAIGSILFGIATEFVLWKRKGVYSLPAGVHRLCLSALVYGLQLTMGYFIMLVIMTYSGPLFICTIIGMMLGHVCFNAQDSFAKNWVKKNDEVGKDEKELSPRDTSKRSSYQQIGDKNGIEVPSTPTENTNLKSSVPEGITPCCQYTL